MTDPTKPADPPNPPNKPKPRMQRRSVPYWERRRTLSDEQICARYAAGQASIDIAIAAKCCATTILEIARHAGIAIRQRGGSRRLNLKLSDQTIVARYVSGESGAALARAAGCHTPTIYHILNLAGITRRHTNVGRKPTKPIAPTAPTMPAAPKATQ
jgi:hypothetical protein